MRLGVFFFAVCLFALITAFTLAASLTVSFAIQLIFPAIDAGVRLMAGILVVGISEGLTMALVRLTAVELNDGFIKECEEFMDEREKIQGE